MSLEKFPDAGHNSRFTEIVSYDTDNPLLYLVIVYSTNPLRDPLTVPIIVYVVPSFADCSIRASIVPSITSNQSTATRGAKEQGCPGRA